MVKAVGDNVDNVFCYQHFVHSLVHTFRRIIHTYISVFLDLPFCQPSAFMGLSHKMIRANDTAIQLILANLDRARRGLSRGAVFSVLASCALKTQPPMPPFVFVERIAKINWMA